MFALYGPWGSGKSSVLNLVLEYVKDQAKPGEMLVLKFDPWWYAGDEQLVQQFFRQLRGALGREDVAPRLRDLGAKLETFAKAVAPFAYVPGIGEIAKVVREGLRTSGEAVRGAGTQMAEDAERQRREIDELLNKQESRIWS